MFWLQLVGEVESSNESAASTSLCGFTKHLQSGVALNGCAVLCQRAHSGKGGLRRPGKLVDSFAFSLPCGNPGACVLVQLADGFRYIYTVHVTSAGDESVVARSSRNTWRRGTSTSVAGGEAWNRSPLSSDRLDKIVGKSLIP